MDVKLAEQMAVAVLRGDMSAAMALADLLSENQDAVRVEPVIKIEVPLSRLRVALLLKDNVTINEEERQTTTLVIRDWLLTSNQPLLLAGVERIQIYQLPENI